MFTELHSDGCSTRKKGLKSGVSIKLWRPSNDGTVSPHSIAFKLPNARGSRLSRSFFFFSSFQRGRRVILQFNSQLCMPVLFSIFSFFAAHQNETGSKVFQEQTLYRRSLDRIDSSQLERSSGYIPNGFICGASCIELRDSGPRHVFTRCSYAIQFGHL